MFLVASEIVARDLSLFRMEALVRLRPVRMSPGAGVYATMAPPLAGGLGNTLVGVEDGDVIDMASRMAEVAQFVLDQEGIRWALCPQCTRTLEESDGVWTCPYDGWSAPLGSLRATADRSPVGPAPGLVREAIELVERDLAAFMLADWIRFWIQPGEPGQPGLGVRAQTTELRRTRPSEEPHVEEHSQTLADLPASDLQSAARRVAKLAQFVLAAARVEWPLCPQCLGELDLPPGVEVWTCPEDGWSTPIGTLDAS